MDKDELGRILIIIGGLVGLIEAIMGFITPGWFGLFGSILALIVSIVILLSCFKPDDPIPFNAVVELVLAIILLIVGSWIGGVIAIIGAILLFLD